MADTLSDNCNGVKLTANEIRFIRSLGTKKGREEAGLFVVEGEKMVAEVRNSPKWKVERIIRRTDIGQEQMERISQTDSSTPVLALVHIPEGRRELDPGGLCLALDSVRDPGNLGTILRIADWFGIDAVYCSPDCVELYNPKVVQSTMGAIFRVNTVYTPLVPVCDAFRASGLRVFGTFLNGASLYGMPLPSEGLIVMGNESAGVSAEVEARSTDRITIPSFAAGPHAESLNVAIATAVTVAEFRRRTL